MEGEVEYEALPGSTTLTAHMVAGAAAGIMEHCVMYPIDSVKTRMQSLVPDPRANYRNMFHALSQIIRDESVWSTMRGIDATAFGSGPAHAVYFACYEYLKKTLSRPNEANHLVHGIAGCGATVVHDIVYNPFEVIKQRMQVFASPYKNWLECTRVVLTTEGIGAFYRSFGTQLVMNIPYQSLHFIMYEFCQDLMNKDRAYHPMSHVLSGGAAGAVASAATTPFDVIKTLLNTQEKNAFAKGEMGISEMAFHLSSVHANRFQYSGTAPTKKEMNSRVATRDSPINLDFYARKTRKAGSVSGLSFGDDPSYDESFPSGMRIENTYQLDPTMTFPVNVVHDVIDDVLRSYLTNELYQEELCREMAKTLSEVVKVRIRELQIPRYRFICRVDIGQQGQQGVSIASSFLWDATSDNYCTGEFRNNSLFAVCTVYAVYTE